MSRVVRESGRKKIHSVRGIKNVFQKKMISELGLEGRKFIYLHVCIIFIYSIFSTFPSILLIVSKKIGAGGTLGFAVILSILRTVPLNKYIMDKRSEDKAW